MNNLDAIGKVINTDVLVVGGGVSGLWTAIKARGSVGRVTIVDKGPRDWGGLASMAGGDIIAVQPGENVDDFVKDLIYYYDGLCEQDLIEEVFRHSYDRFRDYERLGCEFLRTPGGKLKGIPQRSLEHVKLYPSKPDRSGGADMVKGLVSEADRLGIQRFHRTLVTDLIKCDGRMAGAVGFHTITGEFIIFEVRAVVLATGQAGWKSAKNMTSGEGMSMALRSGAELKNCEFAQVWNVPRFFAWEGQTKLLPLGAKFVNAMGESYMDRYSPRFGAATDPHYNVRGMAIEARAGRGSTFLDTCGIKPQDIGLVQPQSGWQKLNYEKLTGLGIDLFRDRTEWVPQLVSLYGGVVADIQGKTSVLGLYVAGRVRSLDAGVYMGGFALCNTAVTGFLAGKSVAAYVNSTVPLHMDLQEVVSLKKALFSFLKDDGITPKQGLTAIRKVVFPYQVCILKTEKNLKEALVKLKRLEEQILPRLGAPDPHYLMKLIEVKGIAIITECFLRASLLRTESRAGHYREDYPNRDDKDWLKWIAISQRKGELHLRTEPVPLARYKFKPSLYYMDNFTFPDTKVKSGN